MFPAWGAARGVAGAPGWLQLLQRRYKSKTHWAKLKRKIGPTHAALNHFDDFYGSVFQERWEPIKKALLRKSKYVALVNNYGDSDATIELLTNRGAHCIKKLFEVDKQFRNEYHTDKSVPDELNSYTDDAIRSYSSKAQELDIASIYKGDVVPDRLETSEMTLVKTVDESANNESAAYNASLDKSLADAHIDETRFIDASIGLSSGALWQYVPATKLKGMEDWIPESQHYAYYSKGKDFPLTIEAESEFEFPEHLKVFTYEVENVSLFPEPRRDNTGVVNYYPLDGGSVMAVLALGLRAGDRVLDLCAAPGGKALVALQTLLPGIIVCNDASISRNNRMKQIFKDYLMDYETSNKWQERVLLTRLDGREFRDQQPFDKVLVDVPCTTDRHSVMVEENNIFRSDRIKERLKIPEMQSQLLVNALKLVKVGGTVVYSTCSLSPIQNDGVVHMSLKQAFELHGVQAVIRDMTKVLSPFKSMMRLGVASTAPRYGQLVTPHVAANFGPSYFCKLVRVS